MDQQEAAYAAQEIESRLRNGHFAPSLILQLCDYVRKPARDAWQASSPVPTSSPRDLRDWLLANHQLSDDARVKYLLGMCHAALGELLAEVDKAKDAAMVQWPDVVEIPTDADEICQFIATHRVSGGSQVQRLLDGCQQAMVYIKGHIRDLLDQHHAVSRALRGDHIPSAAATFNNADAVDALYKLAHAPKVDPWQASHQIPDEAEQLCAFILNNHLTDDDRMQNLLLRCHSKIQALLWQNKELTQKQTAIEEALGTGWWAGPKGKAESLVDAAKRIRAELDRMCSAAEPAQVALVSQQIADAKEQWGDGCGKQINEVFRSCDTLLDAVRVLTAQRDHAEAAAGKAVELVRRKVAASPSQAMIDQAVKVGARAYGLTGSTSPGPWIAEKGLVRMAGFKAPEIADCSLRLRDSGGRYNDADFIAEARSVVPEMSELLLIIAKKAAEGMVLPDEIAGLIATIDGVLPPAVTDARADACAKEAGQLQHEIERLDAELTAAKKHVAEVEERAAHNENRAVEEGHRVMAAERRYVELSSLLDQRLSAPLSDVHRDLSDIDQLLDKASLLVTLCSGGPWILCAEAGELTVIDAGKRPVAMLVEPAPGNLETRNYNGKFVAASRGLVVNLVEVARRLVSGLRQSRANNVALQSLSRDKDQEIVALNDKLTRAKADQDAEVQRRVDVVGAEAACLTWRIIGNQQLRSEKFREETAAVEERLRQALAEVVFVRDSLENTVSRAQEAETELNEAKGLLSKKTAEVAQLTADLNKALAGERETCATADRLRDELDAHERRIHLQQSRTAAANRLWQKETGRRDTIPDRGDLIAWLLKRAGAAEKKLALAVESERAANSRIDELANGIRAYRFWVQGRHDDVREDCWWTRASVQWEKDHGGSGIAKDIAQGVDWQPRHLVELAAAGLAVCKENGWKRDRQHGGLYLHLEASEFVEALRGKGTSTPEAEAADVLFVLITVCAANGVSLEKALSHLRELCRMKDGRLDIASGAVYLIQDSRQYVGNDVLWWRPNSDGYTCQIEEAGLYDEAFVRNRRATDKVYRAADIYPLATRVVDVQRIHSAGVKPVSFDKDPAR